jgi:acetyl-CoA acetyltransferase
MAGASPPRSTRAAIVAGFGIGRFGRFPAATLTELATPVVATALKDAGVAASQIEAAYVGNAFGGAIAGQESILGQIVLAPAGIAGQPIHTIKNACSSGADAVHLAWSAIAFGQYDCVLALGVEKLTHEDRARSFAALASATDQAPRGEGRSVFMDVNADRSRAYMDMYGATARHFALCTAKNRAHAALNERAAVRKTLSVDEILAAETVVPPLTRAMCGGIVDGSAAVVLMSERAARRAGSAGPRIVASAVASGVPEGDARGNATARAGAAAYDQAGLGPDAISFAEVHDPTAPQELFDIEDLGLCARGEGWMLIEAGATRLGGRLPVNVSGGLTARGHPVGATGVAQIAELAEQLTGRAGRRQIERPTVGLAQMAGGLLGRDSAVAAVHILTI